MAKKKPAAKKVAKKATGKQPATFSVPVAEVAVKRRQIEAIASGTPVLGWTRWCPQTFSDGKGMGAAGAPVSSLVAINPSPADCEIVACEMQQAEKARQAATDELTKWSNAGATFFKDARKRFGSELQVAL